MSTNFLSDHAAEYLAECEECWVAHSLPRRHIDMLKAQTEPSIRAALQDGSRIEDVLGASREWAESEAKAYLKVRSLNELRRFRALLVLSIFLIVGAGIILSQHILHATLSFPIGFEAIALTVFVGTSVRLAQSPGLPFFAFNLAKRKGPATLRLWLCFCAGLLAFGIVPLRTVGEASPGLIQWSWLHSLALIAVTVGVSVACHRCDPTRLSAGQDPRVEEWLGLVPTDEVSLRRRRRRERAALAWMCWSACCSGLGWLLTLPDASEGAGRLFILSLCCLLLMMYSGLVNRQANANLVRT